MNKTEALKRYPKYKDILENYSDADEACWMNAGDKDLHPIRIPLPEPPDWSLIDGFGLPAEDQVFTCEKIPIKLKHMEDEVRMGVDNDEKYGRMSETKKMNEFLDRAWDFMEKHQDDYKEEIKWIKKQWWHRLNGYWFFCNGKPVYLCGWNWFYLNYWSVEQVLEIEYRDRDRRWFHAIWFCYNDTTSPITREVDGEQKLLYDDHGGLRLMNIGSRTCFGYNDIKGRRVGDTSKTECVDCLILTHSPDRVCGIQGDSDSTAKKTFLKHFANPYEKLYWIWKPKTSNQQPKNIMVCKEGAVSQSLGSIIDYATTAQKEFYDGDKLNFYHGEEAGKTKLESIKDRHNVVKRCLAQGTNIVGFAGYTTTVDEMDAVSGKEFLKLTNESHYETRNENGQTTSGLYNIFIPAHDGTEGFIGKYGESIIDDPTPKQIEWLKINKKLNVDVHGKPMGSKRYYLNQRKALEAANNIEGLVQHKRLHPMSFREAFTPPAKNAFFNMHILSERISELQMLKNVTRRGDLVWSNGMDSEVIWMDNPINGKFIISKILSSKEANNKMRIQGVWTPSDTTSFIASSDSFRVEKVERHGRMSDGAGAVYWNRDFSVDPEDKDVKDWVSECFVCTYSNRPDDLDVYCEDMLKMCVYYNAMMFPENNVDHVIKHFIERGYGGYLSYDTDLYTGKAKNNPGFYSGGGFKQKLFNYMKDWIDHHASRCKHIELLDECSCILGMDDMTNYDLFTAAVGCLAGKQSDYNDYLRGARQDSIDIGGLFSLKSY
jgi:hypothetical protein